MSRINPFYQNRPKRVLIAFMTAHISSRRKFIEAQRERMKGSPLPYVFVFGDSGSQEEVIPRREALQDELFFPVNDTKPFMVHKDQALFKWALDRGYDFIFRACDDSIVHPDRLIKHFDTLSQHDYAGTMCGYGGMAGQSGIFTLRYLDYMHGGVGIWLSRRAMEMLVADKWKGPYSSPYSNKIEILPGTHFDGSWNIYWDDLWMGEVLKGNLNYNDPKRNEVYDNYLVHVYDAPTLFASNLPYDPELVISTHSLEQMGTSDLKPLPYSTRTNRMEYLEVNWDSAKSDFKAVVPK